MMNDCVFCDKILRLDFDISLDGTVGSFEPLNPVVPGHRLFVPLTHSKDASVSPMRASWAFREAARYVADEGIQANIITSVGPCATQSVFHTHVHVVPRTSGDELPLPWTPQQRKKDEMPEDQTDAWKTSHHRTSIRTGFLVTLYILVVFLLGLSAFSFGMNPNATTEDRWLTVVVFGLLAAAFLVIAYVTVRDRRHDVDNNGKDEDNVITRKEKF